MGRTITISKSKSLKIALFFLLIMLASATAPASASWETDGYIITGSTLPGDYIDSSGTDGIRNFEDTPLWIKILFISGAAFSSLCLLKYIPFIIGKWDEKIPNEKRKKIMKFIFNNPRCTTTEINAYTAINTGTVRYHLYMLEKNRDIVSVKTGHIFCYFQNKSRFSHEQRVIMALCRNVTTKKIIYIIKEKPGVSNNSVSRMIGIDKSTVHWHIKRLSEAGVIKNKKEGKFSKFFMTSEYEKSVLQ
ncbi:MAG: winged helix-turn-helix transcriptional regulator [Euryarchaeota archaeon]|nr:winged helix-turn-helix transcriptional regulator [Euryarchaeota archaeon]